MSELPPPIEPEVPYAQAGYVPQYAAPAPTRPGSISVMSILAIVFGSLGLMCGLFGVASQGITLAMGGRNLFAPNVPLMSTAVTAYGAFSALVSLGLSAVLLTGGIGGLKLRPWARRLLIGWSIAQISWATVNLIITLLWVNPATANYVRQAQLQTNPQAAKMMGSLMGPLQMATAIIGWLLYCILPVCFLILWRSPKVIAAFEQPETEDLRP